jgi:hypothetical protein
MLLDAVVILHAYENSSRICLVLRHSRLQLDGYVGAAARLREQGVLQIGAMADDIGRAPAFFRLIANGEMQQFLAARTILQANGLRLNRRVFQAFKHAEAVQQPRRVRRELQTRSDFRQRCALFENLDVKSLFAEGKGKGQAGNAGASNNDLIRIGNSPVSFCLQIDEGCFQAAALST